MPDKSQNVLLMLIRNALWRSTEALPDADWDVVEKYAQDQGVLWIVYLGAKALKQSNCSLQLISKERLKNWRSALYTSAFYNDQINGVQMHLIQWMAENKVRAAILKGTSCSRYYPFPEARPLGDDARALAGKLRVPNEKHFFERFDISAFFYQIVALIQNFVLLYQKKKIISVRLTQIHVKKSPSVRRGHSDNPDFVGRKINGVEIPQKLPYLQYRDAVDGNGFFALF